MTAEPTGLVTGASAGPAGQPLPTVSVAPSALVPAVTA
jgi:hypothetical protein